VSSRNCSRIDDRRAATHSSMIVEEAELTPHAEDEHTAVSHITARASCTCVHIHPAAD
jgi:hypothetical protein